jgi:hypothetical protein
LYVGLRYGVLILLWGVRIDPPWTVAPVSATFGRKDFPRTEREREGERKSLVCKSRSIDHDVHDSAEIVSLKSRDEKGSNFTTGARAAGVSSNYFVISQTLAKE